MRWWTALLDGLGPALSLAAWETGAWAAWFAGRGEPAAVASLFAGLHELAEDPAP